MGAVLRAWLVAGSEPPRSGPQITTMLLAYQAHARICGELFVLSASFDHRYHSLQALRREQISASAAGLSTFERFPSRAYDNQLQVVSSRSAGAAGRERSSRCAGSRGGEWFAWSAGRGP